MMIINQGKKTSEGGNFDSDQAPIDNKSICKIP